MEAREALLDRVSAVGGDAEIKDPATGAVIGRHTFGTAADVKAAVDKAAAAQPAWAALTDEERVGYLMRCADAVEAHAEELAYEVSREQGKTMSGIGARYEIDGCVGWLRATAATPLPREVLVDDGATYAEMRYRPIGVVGAITPWNWPLIIAIWQIAPSLRMGNSLGSTRCSPTACWSRSPAPAKSATPSSGTSGSARSCSPARSGPRSSASTSPMRSTTRSSTRWPRSRPRSDGGRSR